MATLTQSIERINRLKELPMTTLAVSTENRSKTASQELPNVATSRAVEEAEQIIATTDRVARVLAPVHWWEEFLLKTRRQVPAFYEGLSGRAMTEREQKNLKIVEFEDRREAYFTPI
jgi:hypothetical protein